MVMDDVNKKKVNNRKEMSADELVFNEGIFLDIIAYLRDFLSRIVLMIGAAMIVTIAAKKTI